MKKVNKKKKNWKRGGQVLKEKLSKKDLSKYFSELVKKRWEKHEKMRKFYEENHKN